MRTLLRIAALSIPLALAGCTGIDLGLQPFFGSAPVVAKKAIKKAAVVNPAVPAKPAIKHAVPVKPLSMLDPPECDMGNLKLGCKDSAIDHVVKADAATIVEMQPASDKTAY